MNSMRIAGFIEFYSYYYCFGINFKNDLSSLKTHINRIEKTKNMFNQPYLIIWSGRN